MVRRDNKFIVPRGQTVIKPYDTLLVMATDGNFRVIDQLLNDEK
ncbi:MAG TPA: TrkA C-terminal domain-containing protein [Phycisphaerae bacterium]|nr:TrkA C-terminal domain-containing protein [Phycisphaerae bacterium]